MDVDRRFMFSGHALGVAAHFHRLDDLENLDHAIPAMASSLIPVTGGRSHQEHKNQVHTADKPRQRTLLSVGHAESTAIGRTLDDTHFETEIHAIVRNLALLDQLHVDLVEMHQTSSRAWDDPHSCFSTKGCKIEGLKLGNVHVKLQLDETPFAECGTRLDLNRLYASESDAFRRENSKRFHSEPDAKSLTEYNGRYYASLVKKIELEGPENEKSKMKVDGYSIKWDGFGKIFLGEVIMTDKERRVTMIRLKMGSSAGGGGGVGDGQTNSITAP
jgi:hypothetical protein